MAALRGADDSCDIEMELVRVRRSQALVGRGPVPAGNRAKRMSGPGRRKRRRAGGLMENPGGWVLRSAVAVVGEARWPPTMDSCYGMEN